MPKSVGAGNQTITWDLIMKLYQIHTGKSISVGPPSEVLKNGGIPAASSRKRKIDASKFIHNQSNVLKKVLKFRVRGDHFFKTEFYEEAVRYYSRALRLSEKCLNLEYSLKASLHHNRAAALIKLCWFDEAIPDCNSAISLENSWVKPYYLKAVALGSIGRFEESNRIFTFLAKSRPDAKIEMPGGFMLMANPNSKVTTTLKHNDLLKICETPSHLHPCCTPLPPRWIARESRIKPGKWFYENLDTKERQWEIPSEKKSRSIKAPGEIKAC